MGINHWTINVASIVKNAPPLGSHVFQAKVTIFILIQDIIWTNLLTKFHAGRKINVASRCWNTVQLSSDNHLVDGPTDPQTDRQTDMSKAIYPLFFERGA
ncbi:hypothetical protein DPMN_082475 [Dreissena polymorpha]|uniref:Uncharacterized protein n=1 Tax=Dreissena polymorpha TaxID=45954 RepID=A0A9D3YAV0_DREPO|nr:hypothetical protein DPMN_082475 [Dreissena polymorpha]